MHAMQRERKQVGGAVCTRWRGHSGESTNNGGGGQIIIA